VADDTGRETAHDTGTLESQGPANRPVSAIIQPVAAVMAASMPADAEITLAHTVVGPTGAPGSAAGIEPAGTGPADIAMNAPFGAPAAPPPATITRIERTTLPDVVRVTIAISDEVVYREQELSGPPRLFFDFVRTRPSAALMDRTLSFEGDGDIIREIRVGRHPNQTTRVVLETTGASTCSVYPLYSPYRLVVDCKRTSDARTTTPPAPRAAPATAAVPTGAATGRADVPPASIAAPAGPPATPAAVAPARSRELASRPVPAVQTIATLAGPQLLRARLAAPLSGEGLPTGRAPLDPVALDPPPSSLEAAVARTASAPPPAAPKAPTGNLSGGFSIARQLGLNVSRIVIDPGHGGHDPGAKGPGITEAALVLDIARRLEQILKETPGTEVILTRRSDVFVSLEERTALANRENADLFLSIHANASASVAAGGVETYFLNFAKTRQAAAVAARENAASGQSMNALPDFVKAIALNNKLDESRDFATEIQRSLVQRLRTSHQTVRDLGVKQAPFVVLIGAAMPSVLAEVAFVTNTDEARLLRGSAYRQKIAEALASAIRKYQSSLAGSERATQP
jgi:N-acetylmuramoyl-L-alanine amidase